MGVGESNKYVFGQGMENSDASEETMSLIPLCFAGFVFLHVYHRSSILGEYQNKAILNSNKIIMEVNAMEVPPK
jgi:hypothetical protein